MKLVVTGATGYIGARLCRLAVQRGHDVIAASRRVPNLAKVAWLPYSLGDDMVVPRDTTAVVHLAADTSGASANESAEVAAAQFLLRQSQAVGARFIFVSSQTAHPDAPTAYGRVKWQIERLVLEAGGAVVRPGQVYGGPEQGLFGVLAATARRLPVLPAFLPAPGIQPIHVDDLCEGLLRLAQHTSLHTALLCLGSAEPIRFTAFLAALTRVRAQRRPWFVPVPIVLIHIARRVFGRQASERLGLERLASLFSLPSMRTHDSLDTLGLSLRPLHAGLQRSGDDRRRRLFKEGRALLSFVLNARPSHALTRRYVRSIEAIRSPFALPLPALLLQHPACIALVTDSTFRSPLDHEEFRWRVDTATALAESCPQGARAFMGLGRGHGWMRSVWDMAGALVAEMIFRITKPVSAAWLSRAVAAEVARA